MSAVNPPGNRVLKERSFSQTIHQNLKKRKKSSYTTSKGNYITIWNQPLGVLYINMDEGSNSEIAHNLYKLNYTYF